jgi:hypothetical protein
VLAWGVQVGLACSWSCAWSRVVVPYMRHVTHTPCVLHTCHSAQLDQAKQGVKEAGLDNVILGGNYVCGKGQCWPLHEC